MHKAQEQVREMYAVFGDPMPSVPRAVGERRHLRASLIIEEAKETMNALLSGNLAESIDGLCDLLYVTYGTAIEMGVDLEQHFDEVHMANLAKFDGSPSRRDDGKWLKPEGWEPPDHSGILQTGRGRYT